MPSVRVLVSTLVIGGVGFLSGFVGPVVLTPESNQGPLVGIFISGPISFVIGIAFGFYSALRPMTQSRFFALLGVLVAGVAAVTLGAIYVSSLR